MICFKETRFSIFSHLWFYIIYQAVMRPVITYANETWVLEEYVKQKLLITERKVLKWHLSLQRKDIVRGEVKQMN